MVCREFEGAYKIDTRKDDNTLLQLVKGAKSMTVSNGERSWLLAKKVWTVIMFTRDVANYGFCAGVPACPDYAFPSHFEPSLLT